MPRSRHRKPLAFHLWHAPLVWRRFLAARPPAFVHFAASALSLAVAIALRSMFTAELSRRGAALIAFAAAAATLLTWFALPARRRHARHLRPQERFLLIAVGAASGTAAAVVRAVVRGSSPELILTYLAIPVIVATLLSTAFVEAWIALHWLRPRRAAPATSEP